MKKTNQMPQAESSGLIPTLNKMGWMTSTLDPFSQEIIAFAAHAPGPFLDIGAAYGVTVLPALAKGCDVIANDMDPRHLEILAEKVPTKDRARLQLRPGRFPEDLNFSPNTLGAILICRVLHFFEGPKIEEALQMAFRWLAPQGKIAIVADTPYLKNFQARIPVYERLKREGHPWPGLVDDVMTYSPDRGQGIPPFMNYLDTDILERVVKQAGFQIEKIATFPREDYPADIRLDGREGVGVIAIKATET